MYIYKMALIDVISLECLSVSCSECICISGRYYPLMAGTNTITRHKEKLPEYIRVTVGFKKGYDAETMASAYEKLAELPGGDQMTRPRYQYKRVVDVQYEDKDIQLRHHHHVMSRIQHYAYEHLGILIGTQLPEYETPEEWMTEGGRYLDYSDCHFFIDCKKGDIIYQELVNANIIKPC